jgi:hypothetical protein
MLGDCGFATFAKVCSSGHILLPISFPALFTIRFGIPVLPLVLSTTFTSTFRITGLHQVQGKKHGHCEQAA